MSRRDAFDGFGCPDHPRFCSLACPGCYSERQNDGSHGARAAVIAAARGLLGTPFQHEGRSAFRGGGGLDCSGAIALSFGRAGIKVPDLRGYSSAFVGAEFVAAWRARMVEVDPIDAGLPADVALLRVGRAEDHAVLLTDVGTLIHACAREGRVVERTLEPTWRARVVMVLRKPELCRTS